MSGSMKENELRELIENLNDRNPEYLNDSLQSLIINFQSGNGQEIVDHFNILFPRLETLLIDDNLSVVVQASQLLLEAVSNYPREAEPYYYNVVGKLVINLGDSRVSNSENNDLFPLARGKKDGFEQSDSISQVKQKL
jgi:hypothetical protein